MSCRGHTHTVPHLVLLCILTSCISFVIHGSLQGDIEELQLWTTTTSVGEYFKKSPTPVKVCTHVHTHTLILSTVYALTFMGLNFCSFRRSVAICKSFIPQKLDQMGNRCANTSQTVKIKMQKSRKLTICESWDIYTILHMYVGMIKFPVLCSSVQCTVCLFCTAVALE